MLSEFISNAQPAIVNVLSDDDGVTRMFPLYYTYKMSDGTTRNLFTATLVLVKRYYRVANEDVSIERDKIVFSSANIPVLDPSTRRLELFEKDFKWLKNKILNPAPPRNTHTTETCLPYSQTGFGWKPSPGKKRRIFPSMC